jgi:hypothetical protein
MTRTISIDGQGRFSLLYEMFAVGAQLAAQCGKRSTADVRAEVRVLDALDAVSAASDTLGGQVLPARSVHGSVLVSVSQPEHELLTRYLDLSAPAFHVAKSRDVVSVLDVVSAAERVE